MDNVIKMEIFPKNIKEGMDIIYNILKQGDSRYNNTGEEVFLSSSLVKQIVSLERRGIPKYKNQKKEN